VAHASGAIAAATADTMIRADVLTTLAIFGKLACRQLDVMGLIGRMHSREGPMADFDSPWKEALDLYFQAFLAFFFPRIHDDIDWARGFESLDKELQQIAPASAHGRRYVDKLVKVWRRNGRTAWVLIHVEVQTQRQRGFARRMYVYNCRIGDHYNRTVVTLAVLADDDPSWRPTTYLEEMWDWSVAMKFPAVKLLDYANRTADLEADSNPFAKIVLAHLKALETRRDPEARQAWKFRLVRGLYEQGFPPTDVRRLFRLIDWLMELPPALDERFWKEVQEYQEERIVPFVTTPERLAIKKLMLEMLDDSLRAKFGDEGAKLLPEIKALEDADKYRALNIVIAKATTLDEVRHACTTAALPESPRKRTRGKRG
jgi:hypothetical protein